MTKIVLLAAACASLISSAVMAQPTMESILGAPRPTPPDPRAELVAPRKPASLRGVFDLISIGDLHYFHPMAASGDKELEKVSQPLKSGDLTVANQEGVFFDMKTFKGAGQAVGMMLGEPGIAKDEKALGVDMVGLANNHGGDWGSEGLLEMTKLLDAAGVVHAEAV